MPRYRSFRDVDWPLLAITLLIAWAVIIGLVLKAASTRPAEVLRHA